jgi:RNA polymerase sigma factor (sigma-70 family)
MTPDATCWTLIHAAAGGDRAAREDFARLYAPVARSYFAARWVKPAATGLTEDAVQDVFVECFKQNGVLVKVVETAPKDFRAYFFGVLKNIARRHEAARKLPELREELLADDTSLSKAFDRAWAVSLLKEAARLQGELAKAAGERAVQRVELLRLRFQEGLPIRDIATRWQTDAAHLHHEYATARTEFRAALAQVVSFHCPHATDAERDTAARELLGLLTG